MAGGVNYVTMADSIASRTAQQYGLDPNYFKAIFQAQINQESGFNPNARSGAGAMGIAQIVPKYHPGVNPLNPQQSLAYAARWDAQNLKKYGNAKDMLSVYNSGRPWAVGQGFGETNNYVKSILGKAGQPVNAAWGGHEGSGATVGGKAGQGQNGLPPKGGKNQSLEMALLQNALSYSQGNEPTSIASLLMNYGGPQNAPVSSPQAAGGVGMQPVGPVRGLKLGAVPAGFSTRPGIELNAPVIGPAEALAKRFGVKINSGYRSPQHNASVGGAQNSDHLSGNAVDFTGSSKAMKALYNFALRNGYAYVEPWSQTGGSHVHISFARNGVKA